MAPFAVAAGLMVRFWVLETTQDFSRHVQGQCFAIFFRAQGEGGCAHRFGPK